MMAGAPIIKNERKIKVIQCNYRTEWQTEIFKETIHMLYLKEINYDDIEKEYLFVRDMPIDENGLTNEWYGVSREDFEKKR